MLRLLLNGNLTVQRQGCTRKKEKCTWQGLAALALGVVGLIYIYIYKYTYSVWLCRCFPLGKGSGWVVFVVVVLCVLQNLQEKSFYHAY